MIKKETSKQIFNKERAASFDKQVAKLAPIREAFHLVMRMVLSELPENARILCVGAGTGAELIYLAKVFPKWRFTAVEPAAAMLEICRKRAEACAITSRCTFHEGYLDTLVESEPFDGATSILVSQFIMQLDARQNFFSQIAARLRPGGYLVSADLASDISTTTHQSLFEVWMQTQKYSGLSDRELEERRAAYGKDLAVLSQREIESIIASSGFDTPVRFYQALLIHSWYSRRLS